MHISYVWEGIIMAEVPLSALNPLIEFRGEFFLETLGTLLRRSLQYTFHGMQGSDILL